MDISKELEKKEKEIEELIEDEYPGLSYKTDIEIEIEKKWKYKKERKKKKVEIQKILEPNGKQKYIIIRKWIIIGNTVKIVHLQIEKMN